MKFWLEIQRRGDVIDRRAIIAAPIVGTADGSCPGCGVTPFLVQGCNAGLIAAGLYRAGGYCRNCGDAVGYIFAEEQTVFGAEEDRAMSEFARCRVY